MKIQHSSGHFPSLKMLKIDPGILELDTDVVELEVDNVELEVDIVDSLLALLSRCPVLETLDTYFDPGFLTNVCVPPSSKRLQFTDRKFSWTCLEIDSDWIDVKDGGSGSGSITKTTLGIIGNLQSVEEAYLDVFSLRESKFVDPMISLLRDRNHDLHLLLRHSTSKVKFCYYGLYVFIYVVLY